MFYIMLKLFKDREYTYLIMIASIINLFVLWILINHSYQQSRFYQEAAKYVLMIGSGILFSKCVSKQITIASEKLVPLTVMGIVLATQFLGLGDYYGNEGRFGVPIWGSPNSTGFIISLALAFNFTKNQQGNSRIEFPLFNSKENINFY